MARTAVLTDPLSVTTIYRGLRQIAFASIGPDRPRRRLLAGRPLALLSSPAQGIMAIGLGLITVARPFGLSLLAL